VSFDQAAVQNIYDKLISHASKVGVFETVNSHEPKSGLTNGMHGAIWVQTIRPVATSGLASTSGVVSFRVRGYLNMLSQPYDAIDPDLMTAMVTLMAEYSGDFNFGSVGGVRNLDLLGQSGESLSWQAGYVEIDRHMYRCIDLTVPVIVNDMWGQVAT
jgi:hypothetical protein